MGPLEVVVALGAALAAVTGTIGADARWLPALGRIVVQRGEIPNGVPFASAPSSGWHNVPVLAELIMHSLTSVAGDRGLLAAQVVAVAARRRGGPAGSWGQLSTGAKVGIIGGGSALFAFFVLIDGKAIVRARFSPARASELR